MRIAFFILLLANLVLVLWQTQIQPYREDNRAFPEIPAENRLVLVSEHYKQSVAANQQPGQDVPEAESTPPTFDIGLPDIEIRGTEPESDIAAEPPAIEVTKACYTMGPFKEAGHAKMVSGRLVEMGATVSQRSKVEQEQYGYRVYLKPYASREEAVAESRKLADNGIRDYYIISDDPEKNNGISLGLFRKKSGAIRRMAQVRRFDFKPHMEIRYRDTTIYWLDYEHLSDIDSQPLWRELTEETPEIQRLHRDCAPAQ
jgi:hypothetical protein